MTFSPRRQAAHAATSFRPTPACRVHTCLRCRASIASAEPCSFVPVVRRVCQTCTGQELILTHVLAARTPWGATLARARRP